MKREGGGRQCFLILFIFSLLMGFSSSVLATLSPISLIGLSDDVPTAYANKINDYTFILKNNENHAVSFEIKSNSNALYINQPLSTCTKILPAQGTCKLALNFTASDNVALVKTHLTLTFAQNRSFALPLTFNVVTKMAKEKMLTSYSEFNWQRSGPNGGEISDVAVSPDNPTILYAGGASSVYKSLDGGKNWTRQGGDELTNLSIQQLVIYHHALYVTAYNHGVYKSTDDGAHWMEVNNGLPKNYRGLFTGDMVVDHDILYLGSDAGVYRSTDDGAHWLLTGSFPEKNIFVQVVQGLLINNNIFYVGTYDHGIYKSVDGGKTWRAINRGLPEQMNIISLQEVNGTIFAASPNYSGQGGIFKSTDAGDTWQKTSGNAFMTGLAKRGDTIYASSSIGVFKYSAVDGQWYTQNSGLIYPFVHRVIATPTVLYAATTGGLYARKNDDANWLPMDVGIRNQWITSTLVLANNEIYVGTIFGAVYKSVDNGDTWSLINTNLIMDNTWGIKNLVANQNGDIYAVTVAAGVYKSTNGGQYFSPMQLPTRDDSDSAPRAVDIIINYPNMYVATQDRQLLRTNDGVKWTIFKSRVENDIRALAVKKQVIFAATENGVYKTAISGKEDWVLINNGLPRDNRDIRGLTIANADTNQALLYAIADNTVYVTNDDQTWQKTNSGLENIGVTKLAANGSSLLAGTRNKGIYLATNLHQPWLAINNPLTENSDIVSLVSNNAVIFVGTIGGFFMAKIEQ